MPHRINPENNIHGAFTLDQGTLKFRTGDAVMVQPLKFAQGFEAWVYVCLLAADPIRDFKGSVESVGIVPGETPACWEVVMREGQKAGH
jgi:hypothetical protein